MPIGSFGGASAVINGKRWGAGGAVVGGLMYVTRGISGNTVAGAIEAYTP